MIMQEHTRSSLRAWLFSKLVAAMAPDLSSANAIRRVIAQDRARGPAKPPARLLKQADFSDEGLGSSRVFRLRPRGKPAGDLRVLYIHGGGYVLDLQAIQWNLVAGLMKRVGGTFMIPIYPLAPEHDWQDSLEAVRQAYVELAKSGSSETILILGDSAGGGLALLLAQALRDTGSPLPGGLLLFSPWLDIGLNGADQPGLERRDPMLTIAFLREAGRLWSRDVLANDPRVSPLFGDHHGLPPTIAFCGGREILASDARRLAQANRDVVLREYAEMMHVWPIAPIPEARRALDEAAEFIRQHFPHSIAGKAISR